MALIRRPSKVIGKFLGNEVVLQNNEPTAESERFERDCAEFTQFLEQAFRGLYGADYPRVAALL